MKSQYFNEEHELFRMSLKDFFAKEINPKLKEWEKAQQIPRTTWKMMGDMGYLGLGHEEEYGGLNVDWFTNVVFCEELGATLNGGFSAAITVHEYMAINHLSRAGSPEQKEQYLVPAISGDKIACLGMSEPHVGSNVQGLKTHAIDKGAYYEISGSKIFITNGYYGDFMTVCCNTENGISLILLDLDSEGVSRNKLEKIGWHSSDTAEVFFDHVKVPKKNLLGEEGKGFYLIADSLQTERIIGAITTLGTLSETLEITKQYMREREAFGKSISKHQVLRHRIADLETEIEAAKQLVYSTVWKLEQGIFAVKECSMCKLLTSELSLKVTNECLQMFGGYGFMEDFPIAQVYRDVRANTIAGGTSEIMREIISKVVLDGTKYQKAY